MTWRTEERGVRGPSPGTPRTGGRRRRPARSGPARPAEALPGPRHSRFLSKYPRWKRGGEKITKNKPQKPHTARGGKSTKKQTQKKPSKPKPPAVPTSCSGACEFRAEPPAISARGRPGARGGCGGQNPSGRPAGTVRGEPPTEGARPGGAAGLPPGAAAATTCRRPAAAAAPRGARLGRPPASSGPPASGARRPDVTPARGRAPGLPRRPGPEAELPRGGRPFPRQHPAPLPARQEPHALPREKVNEKTRCFPGARSSIVFQITPPKSNPPNSNSNNKPYPRALRRNCGQHHG
uniref:translation initiation factor IF-2-like n=1 Tax=Agelaius phoeniceus TaxID=39638 RepID=UPI0023EB60F4|nr:translation initiation factor IF-2-like [Agelaius phoeniceus]